MPKSSSKTNLGKYNRAWEHEHATFGTYSGLKTHVHTLIQRAYTMELDAAIAAYKDQDATKLPLFTAVTSNSKSSVNVYNIHDVLEVNIHAFRVFSNLFEKIQLRISEAMGAYGYIYYKGAPLHPKYDACPVAPPYYGSKYSYKVYMNVADYSMNLVFTDNKNYLTMFDRLGIVSRDYTDYLWLSLKGVHAMGDFLNKDVLRAPVNVEPTEQFVQHAEESWTEFCSRATIIRSPEDLHTEDPRIGSDIVMARVFLKILSELDTRMAILARRYYLQFLEAGKIDEQFSGSVAVNNHVTLTRSHRRCWPVSSKYMIFDDDTKNVLRGRLTLSPPMHYARLSEPA